MYHKGTKQKLWEIGPRSKEPIGVIIMDCACSIVGAVTQFSFFTVKKNEEEVEEEEGGEDGQTVK